MSDLNFSGLREGVENETSIPEFREVTRRARRHRRWRVLVNTARVIGILALTTPAIVIGDVMLTHLTPPTTSGPLPIGVGGDGGVFTGPTGPTSAQVHVTQQVVAVDGIDANHTYALIDVCQAVTTCSLQLSPVDSNPTADTNPQFGLLRTATDQTVTEPRVVVENTSTVVVSGIVDSGPRVYRTISLTPAPGAVAPTVRPIQPLVEGAIQTVKGGIGAPATLANQPPVSGPQLESAKDGWWVVGTMPDGELAVSVSRNAGRKWSVHSVGMTPDPSTPTETSLATTDGEDVFLLVTGPSGTSLLYSADGGVTWIPRTPIQPWPTSDASGLVATGNSTLIAWFTSHGDTSYLVSTDLGNSFHLPTVAATPSGPIVTVGGGFMTLGTDPMTSSDGLTWQSAYVPYVPVTQ